MAGGCNSQTTAPKSFPIPAVKAIANAPQNVTRAVARKTFAPPALAPTAPRRARKPKDAANTTGTSALAGDTTTMSKGMAAPTENVAADVSAACTGRAVVISEIPEFIARVGGQGILCHQLPGNLPRKNLIDAALDVDFGKFINVKLDIFAQLLAFAREVRPFGVGLRADRHILAGGHRHGAGHQSRDTRDQDVVLRRGRRGNADDQACRRDNAIVRPENRCSQPPDAADEMALRVQSKTTHPDIPQVGSHGFCSRVSGESALFPQDIVDGQSYV